MTAAKEKLVVHSAVRVIPVDKICTDTSYQRTLKGRHKKIIANFDEDAFGVPVVGEREDGSLWIVDGLQRLGACIKLGKTHIRAAVFSSKGPEHEARVFTLIDLERTRLLPGEEFKALLASGDETAWKIKEAVESVGYRIRLTGGGPAPGERLPSVGCITAMRKEAGYSKGIEAIKFALRMALQCWPGDALGTHNTIFAGLASFFRANDGAVDEDRLVPRLAKVTPSKIIYTANQTSIGGSKILATAEAIERIYKKRKA
jgi:hypothetical protein